MSETTTAKPKISDSAKVSKGGDVYNNSVAALRVLIAEDYVTRVIPPSATRPNPITLYVKRAILIGGPIVQNFEVASRDLEQLEKGGMYHLSAGIFSVGQYGDLEVPRYADNKYIWIKPLSEEHEAMFIRRSTSMDDLG